MRRKQEHIRYIISIVLCIVMLLLCKDVASKEQSVNNNTCVTVDCMEWLSGMTDGRMVGMAYGMTGITDGMTGWMSSGVGSDGCIACVSLTHWVVDGASGHVSKWKMVGQLTGIVAEQHGCPSQRCSMVQCTRQITFCQLVVAHDDRCFKVVAELFNANHSWELNKHRTSDDLAMLSCCQDVGDAELLESCLAFVCQLAGCSEKWWGVGQFPLFDGTAVLAMCTSDIHTFTKQHLTS